MEDSPARKQPDEPIDPDVHIVVPAGTDPEDPMAQTIARFGAESERLARRPPDWPTQYPYHSLSGQAIWERSG